MKEYLKFFRWILITIGVLVVILLGIEGLHKIKSSTNHYERTNTECTTTQRVFDHADVLTDKEEQKLEDLIAKREKQTGCDIVLVTLNESLKEYAREIEPDVSYDQFVRVFAEQFYEENNFGYNKPNGDGVILVDNWYREDDGRIYTWFCTTGIVKDTYSDLDIDHILDRVYRDVETNPYKAYKTYVNDFYDDMMGTRLFDVDVPKGISIIVGLVAAVIFIIANWKSKSGKDTTTAVTYVEGKKADFVNNRDVFVRKSVTKRHIQTSSSSGGGHSGGGGGGGSHGGGGHSR
ncbi:MAG: TPM domain-containing protein [Lachnospiraceae bacterium]|nr:TPM domain-containing protein [Lachnospiraceae bacterium]